jgi:hypothetical protein
VATANTNSSASRAIGVVLVAVLAVVAIVAVAMLAARAAAAPAASDGPSATPIVTVSPSPSAAPSAAPSDEPPATPSTAPEPTDEPAPEPEPEPTDEPSETPRDAMPITVDLEVATPHEVYVDVVDYPGVVIDARSGPARADASVAYGDLLVENVDDHTLQLTWSDRPGDNGLALYIWRDGDTVRLVLVQPPHDEDGDAMIHDRSLILELNEPVSADGIDAVIVEILDA